MNDVTADFGSDTAEFTAPVLPPPVTQGDLAIMGGLKAVQRLAEQIVHAAIEMGCGSRDAFHARLALEEALANAVKHGNKYDAEKAVHVKYEVDSEGMVATIQDEGEGFDQSAVPDPTDEENLDRANGRGVFLMDQFMDSVEYNDIGNCVTLRKKWSPPES